LGIGRLPTPALSSKEPPSREVHGGGAVGGGGLGAGFGGLSRLARLIAARAAPCAVPPMLAREISPRQQGRSRGRAKRHLRADLSLGLGLVVDDEHGLHLLRGVGAHTDRRRRANGRGRGSPRGSADGGGRRGGKGRGGGDRCRCWHAAAITRRARPERAAPSTRHGGVCSGDAGDRGDGARPVARRLLLSAVQRAQGWGEG
jgi:hypothetical protein